jgi:HD superfamily phosphodiesterase
LANSWQDIEIPVEWFDRPNGTNGGRGIHGLGHTRRVLIHATELSATLGLAPDEVEAVAWAALWHDIGRTHDGADYYHGAKSAGKVLGLELHRPLDPTVLDLALFAITHHCGSEEHAERAASSRHTADSDSTLRVFRLLKDADGLDRVRLGDLDVSYLRFPESKERLARAWELLRTIQE